MRALAPSWAVNPWHIAWCQGDIACVFADHAACEPGSPGQIASFANSTAKGLLRYQIQADCSRLGLSLSGIDLHSLAMKFSKLAAAALALASLAPVSAFAAPGVTNLEQINQTVEAVYNNSYSQTASVSGAGSVGIGTGGVVATGAGITNEGVYTLTPNQTDLTPSASVIGGTVTAIADPTTVTAQMAANAANGVLSIDPAALAGDTVTVSTSVFGVSAIKSSQSIIQSNTVTAF